MRVKPKFLIGGGLILVAVVVLIIISAMKNSQYFLTVQELLDQKSQMAQKDVRISGAVIGDSIVFDKDTLTLSFTIANIPGDQNQIDALGGLTKVLHQATIDPSAAHLKVVYHGARPDLLTNEAQAIMTGKLDQDGVFQANDLLLKCPSRYQNALPQQASSK